MSTTALMRILTTGGPSVPAVETPFSKLAKAVLAAGPFGDGSEEGGAPGGDDGTEMGEAPESPEEEMGEPGMGEQEPDGDEMQVLMQMLEQHPALKQLIMQLMMQGGMGGEQGGMGGEEEMPGQEPKPEELLEQTMGGGGSGEAPAEMAGMGAAPSPMKMGSANSMTAAEAMQIARELY